MKVHDIIQSILFQICCDHYIYFVIANRIHRKMVLSYCEDLVVSVIFFEFIR